MGMGEIRAWTKLNFKFTFFVSDLTEFEITDVILNVLKTFCCDNVSLSFGWAIIRAWAII